jgi:hypothetical protein
MFWKSFSPLLSGCGIIHKILPSGEHKAAIHNNDQLNSDVGIHS